MEPGGGDLGELPAVTLGVFIELVSMLSKSLRSRPLVEPQRLSGRISSGAAPPIPATEPRIVCCSCVKRFRKTFRPVFSNSFFVCLWASEGLEFGPPGGVFLGLPAALGRSWAGLGRRGRFLSDFGCHLGSLGRLLGRSWGAPGASWGRPGRSWTALGASWGAPGLHFGLPGASLGSFSGLFLELP